MFNIIFLITGGGPANATQIFPTFAYRAAFTDYLYGQAAAWGVIILSILLVFGTGVPLGSSRRAARRPGREHERERRPARSAARSSAASASRERKRRPGRGRKWYMSLLLHGDPDRRVRDRHLPGLLDPDQLVQAATGDRELDRALDPPAPLADLELRPRPHRRRPHLPHLVLELASPSRSSRRSSASSWRRRRPTRSRATASPATAPPLTAFLITQMFPAAILLVPIYNILLHLGLLNQKLGLVLAYCTVAVPFCVWMLKGYFDTIPISIEEAGRIDGLTPFGTFWRIVIPLRCPALPSRSSTRSSPPGTRSPTRTSCS